MRLAPVSLVLLLVALTAACADPPSPPATPAAHPRPDKRSLYADAGLIPTREGERIRRELALAGEIHASLELLGLGPAHVDVELQPGGEPSVVVVAQVDADADATALEARVADLAAASVPGLPRDRVRVWLHPRAHDRPEPSRERPPWALALTCLGLGLSLGVTLERLRAKRRAQSERRF